MEGGWVLHQGISGEQHIDLTLAGVDDGSSTG